MRILACCLFLTASLVLPGVGCSHTTIEPMPDRFPRLPSASSFGNVWIEGKLYTNHAEIFGTSLLEEGYVPVAVRIFRRGEDADDENSRVSVEDVKPSLYLADGTVLQFIPYDRIHVDPETDDRIMEEALDINVIQPENESREGFLFFALPENEFLIRGDNEIVLVRKPRAHEVRLSDSLVTIEYFTDQGKRPVYVGLRKDRRSDEG